MQISCFQVSSTVKNISISKTNQHRYYKRKPHGVIAQHLSQFLSTITTLIQLMEKKRDA